MLKFVVLLPFFACALGAAIPEGMLPQLDGRIVGGVAVNIANYPYQVSLQRSGSHFCGGTIYSPKVIVTAAHCLQSISASYMRIRAGSSYWNFGGVTVGVASFRNHPNYNKNTMVNDVAVIHLSSSLTYSGNIRNLGLASFTPGQGGSAVVTGWGALKSGSSGPTQLQMVQVKIIRRSECASGKFSYGSRIRETMICAAASGKDACQGDSGGPLASGGVLAGIVSWGSGCAEANYPGVYSNVAELRGWIQSNA